MFRLLVYCSRFRHATQTKLGRSGLSWVIFLGAIWISSVNCLPAKAQATGAVLNDTIPASSNPLSTDVIKVSAREGRFDNKNKRYVLNGEVKVNKGEMVFEGENVTVQQDDNGFQNIVLNGVSGSGKKVPVPASFKHKKAGSPMSAEGVAQKIEYDNKSEVIKLTGGAKIKRRNGDKPSDEISGEQIVYNTKTEFLQLNNGSNQKNAPKVQLIIQPKQ